MSGWLKKWISPKQEINILLEDHLRSVLAPANLRINEQIRTLREICRKKGCKRPYHHFAFGQSPFPPPPAVVRALAENAMKHDYLPTAGLPELRERIAEFYRRHFDLKCSAGQLVVSPGSKEMIAMVLAVVQGTVIIPVPSWVSYLPQAKILKKNVLPLPTRREDGFKVTPDLLESCLKNHPTRQKILILNHPHNPTGLVYSRKELEDLAGVCRRQGVVVISDEIYALTAFEPEQFTSMMKVYPEGTIVTGGLSKDRSCGGYRLGVGLFPEEPRGLIEDVLKLAGSTYSCVAAPIQFAALAAYSMDEDVESYIRDCRSLNALVLRYCSGMMGAIPEVETTTPGGAFYLLVDFNRFGDPFRRLGHRTCADFVQDVLKVEHTAMLQGDSLLLPAEDYRVRCSFVDYDGGKALAAWRRDRPQTPEQERDFLQEYCPLLIGGIEAVRRYLDQVRRGKQPAHVM